MSALSPMHSNPFPLTSLTEADQIGSYQFVCNQEGPFRIEVLFGAGQHLLNLKNKHASEIVRPDLELARQMNDVEGKIHTQWSEFSPEQQTALKAFKPRSRINNPANDSDLKETTKKLFAELQSSTSLPMLQKRPIGGDGNSWGSTLLKIAALMVTLYVSYRGGKWAYNWYRGSSQ